MNSNYLFFFIIVSFHLMNFWICQLWKIGLIRYLELSKYLIIFFPLPRFGQLGLLRCVWVKIVFSSRSVKLTVIGSSPELTSGYWTWHLVQQSHDKVHFRQSCELADSVKNFNSFKESDPAWALEPGPGPRPIRIRIQGPKPIQSQRLGPRSRPVPRWPRPSTPKRRRRPKKFRSGRGWGRTNF